MTYFETLSSFDALYRAHMKARLGKRDTSEVIRFEMNLGENLTRLSDSLRNGTYRPRDYYSFTITDPKERRIFALHYEDRVVQHSICDEALSKIIEPRLIYDNCACRVGKGTLFSMDRLSGFMRQFYRRYGTEGYFLRYDIRKYFDSIDHRILKKMLKKIVSEKRLLDLLFMYIDSYSSPFGEGIGLPLGNQSSQWFALYYMDGLDRLIKEKLHIKYYTRYMDDAVMIHRDKGYLREALSVMEEHIRGLGLEFNQKTQIFPLKNGVDYLGFHFYLTDSGKVIRKVRQSSKKRFKRKIKYMKARYAAGEMDFDEIKMIIDSHRAHMMHGHTRKLMNGLSREWIFLRNE